MVTVVTLSKPTALTATKRQMSVTMARGSQDGWQSVIF